jgi:hypothetical protein
MSTWIERVTNHAVWQRIQESQRIISEALGTATPEEARTDLERLETCIAFIDTSLKSVDTILLTPSVLNTIDQNLISCQNEIKAYISNKNRQHLVNANNNIDNAVTATAQIPRAPSGKEGVEAIKSIDQVRNSAELSLASLNKQGDGLKQALDKISSQLNTLEPAINDQKQRLDKALATQQEQFSKAQDDRNKEFSKERSELSTQSKAFADSLQTTADGTLSELTSIRDKAQNLLHIIGNTGMAGEYAKTANNAKLVSYGWQFVAFAALIGLLVFAFDAYQAIRAPDFNVSATLGRAFVAAAVGILAAYASRQADIYRKSEERARRYQLVLSSIDPYVASLKEDQREAVKIELAKALFGQNLIDAKDGEAPKFDGNITEVLKLLVQIVQASAKPH